MCICAYSRAIIIVFASLCQTCKPWLVHIYKLTKTKMATQKKREKMEKRKKRKENSIENYLATDGKPFLRSRDCRWTGFSRACGARCVIGLIIKKKMVSPDLYTFSSFVCFHLFLVLVSFSPFFYSSFYSNSLLMLFIYLFLF